MATATTTIAKIAQRVLGFDMSTAAPRSLGSLQARHQGVKRPPASASYLAGGAYGQASARPKRMGLIDARPRLATRPAR